MSSTPDTPPAEAGQTAAAGAPASLNPVRLLRIAVAGVLMGVANLIPGVSGGTMILAMGLYQEFIDSVADVTRLKFSLRRIVFLGVLAAFAGGSIVGLAGVILYLLFHHTTAMFALFIGLTLGGAPLLLRLLRPVRADAIISTLVGLGLMLGVSLLKSGSGMPHNTGMDFVSGVVGSTTMVLPGISGSYMLLVMDQYERVVGSIHDLKDAAKNRDFGAVKAAMWIIIPVGIGAVLGIIALSNVLKFLLHRYARPTVGVLLGILLGSVVGLWPFGKPPSEKALERRNAAELRAFGEDWAIPGVAKLVADVDIERLSDAEQETLAGHLREQISENWAKRGQSSYSAERLIKAAVAVVIGFAATFLLSRGKQSAEGAGAG
ncbi:MAG: DUF368 domain-containing protein [Phycisphaerae bacterium]|jgi:putative membrane protein